MRMGQRAEFVAPSYSWPCADACILQTEEGGIGQRHSAGQESMPTLCLTCSSIPFCLSLEKSEVWRDGRYPRPRLEQLHKRVTWVGKVDEEAMAAKLGAWPEGRSSGKL